MNLGSSGWSVWAGWSDCSQSCDGIQHSTRICKGPGFVICAGPSWKLRKCNIQACEGMCNVFYVMNSCSIYWLIGQGNKPKVSDHMSLSPSVSSRLHLSYAQSRTKLNPRFSTCTKPTKVNPARG